MHRTTPPRDGDERSTLRGFLDHHRETLEAKCIGLSEDQLRRRSAPPSELTLLGLVRHAAEVERGWFRKVINAEHEISRVWSHDDPQAAFEVSRADVAGAFEAWRAEVVRAREIESSVASLEATFRHPTWEMDMSLRWILVHVIEEYARHNGHADLLREAVDGSVGA